jgi:RNA polymerase sigma-70 factor (ECF subfamily)
MEQAEVFEEQRPLLFSIAYRMMGTVMEAEDIVQDAYLRWQRVAADKVDSPKAYLSAVVTRLSIDALRSAQAQREQYIGPWLPAPLLTDAANNPAGKQALSESLATAFLIILETLKPVERAVFLLREVFDYDYGEIAQIVGKSEANCRQIVSRARRHIAKRRPRFEVSQTQQTRAVEQFIHSLDTGDPQGLLAVMGPEVTWWSDGGGLPGIARKPIHGAENVTRFVLNITRRAPDNVINRLVEINGAPGVIIVVDGRPFTTLSFDVTGGQITAVYAVVNPEKLRGIPALS